MLAEELIALTSAHGIDLKHVAGISSDTKGVAATRKRTPLERSMGLMEVTPTARGAGSRSSRPPYWSHAELGLAAYGVHNLPWGAARFSFAGDWTWYRPLTYGLARQVVRAAEREGWAVHVRSRAPVDEKGKPIPGARGELKQYMLDLVELVLVEQQLKRYELVVPNLYALFMGVEDPTWERVLLPRYQQLQAGYERWLNIARGMIQKYLSGEPA